MNYNPDYEITELHRRLANLIVFGKIIETNYDGKVPLVRVQAGELNTAWLPILVQRAGDDRSASHYSVGEQVVILSPSGELAQGIVLGSINTEQYSTPSNLNSVHTIHYKDGAIIQYDRQLHHLKAELPSGGTAKLAASGGVEVQGNLKVMGDIESTGDVKDKTRSMAADRDIYNKHTHGGVLNGAGSTGVTLQKK